MDDAFCNKSKMCFLRKCSLCCQPCLCYPLEQGLCIIMGICRVFPMDCGSLCEISPSLTVCIAIQIENHFLSAALFLSLSYSLYVLDIKRENPISAVTFCLCSRNIQGLYIKARQSAQWGKGGLMTTGVWSDNIELLRRRVEVIIPSINPVPHL